MRNKESSKNSHFKYRQKWLRSETFHPSHYFLYLCQKNSCSLPHTGFCVFRSIDFPYGADFGRQMKIIILTHSTTKTSSLTTTITIYQHELRQTTLRFRSRSCRPCSGRSRGGRYYRIRHSWPEAQGFKCQGPKAEDFRQESKAPKSGKDEAGSK